MAHTLPPLPYGYEALEPTIDTQSMHLLHEMHDAAYVNILNAALEKHPNLQSKSAEELLININNVPEDIRTAVRNNGGGHVNHSMFWKIMQPGGSGEATDAIGKAIKDTFGGFSDFQTKFVEAGTKHFGSGWVWLVRARDGKVQLITTPNQDNPLMQGLFPVMGNDLWEHAYYLKYNNRRADYLKAWWNVVNWKEINRRFEESLDQLKKITVTAA